MLPHAQIARVLDHLLGQHRLALAADAVATDHGAAIGAIDQDAARLEESDGGVEPRLALGDRIGPQDRR